MLFISFLNCSYLKSFFRIKFLEFRRRLMDPKNETKQEDETKNEKELKKVKRYFRKFQKKKNLLKSEIDNQEKQLSENQKKQNIPNERKQKTKTNKAIKLKVEKFKNNDKEKKKFYKPYLSLKDAESGVKSGKLIKVGF